MQRIYGILIVFFCAMSIVTASSEPVETSTDKLDIGESFGQVVAAFDKGDIAELKSGTITTNKGATDYNQYIRFSGLTRPVVQYGKDDNNVVQDFLFINSGSGATEAFFEYELEFEDGLQSDIAEKTLEDIEGKIVYIFTTPFTVVFARSESNEIELLLAGGAVTDFVAETQTKTFTIDNEQYEVGIVLVNDVEKSAKLRINGVETPALKKGEVYTLPDEKLVGISRILVGSGNTADLVEVFVGGSLIRLKDSDATDSSFVQDVDLNQENVNGGYVSISATITTADVSISKIKYRLATANDVYVKSSQLVSNYIGKDGFLVNWDFRYDGLSSVSTGNIKFLPSSTDDAYKLSFTNARGNSFSNIPFATTIGGSFILGDGSSNLTIAENINISTDGYFIITDKNDKTGSTYVLRYSSLTSSTNTIKFYDYAAASERSFTYTTSSTSGILGDGNLTVGSLETNFIISDGTGNPIMVDLNIDGSIDAGDTVFIVTKYGGVLETDELVSSRRLTLVTAATQFEENGSDENLIITFDERAGGVLGINESIGGMTMYTSNENNLGLSTYGVAAELQNPANDEAETLDLNYPEKQRFAVVQLLTGESTSAVTSVEESNVTAMCGNGIQDGAETGVDCGGACPPCQIALPFGSCIDGVQNQNETGVDCGGPCPACNVTFVPKCPNGCVHIGPDGQEICLNIGNFTDSVYCSKSRETKLRKSNGLSCEEGYECKIGICEDGKCGKRISVISLIFNIAVLVAFFGSLIYIIEVLIKRQ